MKRKEVMIKILILKNNKKRKIILIVNQNKK
jgi:hypothetical protein